MRNLILRPVSRCLARRLAGLRDDGGRGAISVLVAVLLGAGVLFGMATLVVDVGRLYQNRAELQNGADAGALAIARSCAGGNCTQSTVTSLAAQYANANASALTGGKASVTLICGSTTVGTGSVSVGTGYCSAAKKGCPAVPPAGTNYVDVETATPTSAGGTSVLQPFFSSSRSNGPVRACAQAEWGSPQSYQSIGVTISGCMWDQSTHYNASTGQATYAPPPPYNEKDPATLALLQPLDKTIYIKNDPSSDICYPGPGGASAPGNFGWTSKKNCTVLISGTTYPGATGNSGGGDCQPLMAGWQSGQTVIDVPIYVPPPLNPGGNATYTLRGFAPFVVTGFSMPGNGGTVNDWVTGQPPCTGGAWCVSGFFTHDLVSTSSPLTGVNLGLAIVKLTG